MAKGPISFRERVKKHSKKTAPRPQRGPGELDEWLDYWRHRVRHPLAMGGRSFWTERMLYGNGIAGGLVLALVETFRLGFSVLAFVSAVLNVVFLVFIWYYAVPWLASAIHGALTASRRPPDAQGLKYELIAGSGLFAVLPLVCLLSFGLAFWLGALLLALTLWRFLRFYFDGPLAASLLETVAATTLMGLVTIFFFR